MRSLSDVPVIVEAAINGMTPKSRNPAAPKTTDEVIENAIACLDAGASIIHFHSSGFDLSTQQSVDEYAPAFRGILRERPNAILYPTGKHGSSMNERMEHQFVLAEMGLLGMGYFDPGSVNVAAEDDDLGLPQRGAAYVNTFDDCRLMFDKFANRGIAASIAIYEPGFLLVVLAYYRAGRLPIGSMIKFYFGGEYSPFTGKRAVTHGLPPTPTSLDALLAMSHGCELPWAVGAFGGDIGRSSVLPYALELGGHVRLGLEDYCGDRIPTNIELINEVKSIAHHTHRKLATPEQTSKILGIPSKV